MTAFGTLLRRLREGRGLSLRELSQLSKLDHAYIHRLETGEKGSPSSEALGRLARSLKANKRQERLLRFLVGRDVALELLDSEIVDDPKVALEDFEATAQMSFLGKTPLGPAEWRRRIEKIRQLREEFEGG